jgi:hypothetical protein
MSEGKEISRSSSYWLRVRKGFLYAPLFGFILATLLALPYFGLIRAVIFGIFLNILLIIGWSILCLLDYIAMRKLFRKFGTIDYSICQTREITIEKPFKATYPMFVNAIKKLKHIKNISLNEEKGMIRITTGFNFRTSGDIITIKLLSNSSDRTRVQISSKPRLKTVIFDYGKNYENAEKIKKLILKQNYLG